MKAAQYHTYGSPQVVKITEVPKPVPKPNEILIKVEAATVTAGDVRLRASDFPPLFWLPARIIFGLFKPKKKTLGHEFAGVVEAVGNQVTRFAVGDEVMGTTTMLPTGSHAEYLCTLEQWKSGVLAKKPKDLRFDQAAALPVGGMTALFLLEKAKIDQTKNVLIYGASGSVESYAVQLAKHLGKNVIGVCSSENVDFVKSLGADQVIDYKTQDYRTMVSDLDIVLDAVGKTSKSDAKQILRKSGAFVSVEMITSEKLEHLDQLIKLAKKGKIKAYVDRTFSLDEIVDAHTYVDSGRKKGNVVIKP